ncbi:hypothetical protein DMH03_25720 [Amycolatopsis sp. WAC 01376]|nr:hypothetical protein DMH03_25720 [Amycolatopsis sp. WAC 01376]
MRKSISTAVATSAAVTAIVPTAPAASAEPNPPGCEKGYFCVYDYYPGGPLLLKTAGNWSGSVGGAQYLFNNGYYSPGSDHVDVTWILSSTGATHTMCLHNNPGPGYYSSTMHGTVINVRWRGEC